MESGQLEQSIEALQIKALAATLDGVVLISDTEGRVQSLWAEIQEHPLIELQNAVGQSLQNIFETSFWDAFQADFAKIVREHKRQTFEFSAEATPAKDWYQVILNYLSDTEDGLVSILVRNITRIRHDREALKQGQTSLQAVVSSLDDLVFLLDTSGVFIDYWTRDPQNLFLAPEQFLGHPLEAVFEAETARMFRNAITWVLHSRKPQTVDYPSSDGTTWFEATVNAVEPPDMSMRISLLVKNITRRKQAEISLLRFQEGLTTLNQISFDPQLNAAEQIQEGLNLMLDYLHLSLGVVSRIDKDQYTLLNGVSRGPELAIPMGSTVPIQDTFCQYIWQRKQIMAERDLETTDWGLHPNLKEMHLRSFIGTILQVENQPYGTVSFFDTEPYPQDFHIYDLEFVRIFARWISFVLEQELQKERLIAINLNKERIMDVIAHDLRNPMGAVKGLAEYAMRMSEMPKAQKEILQGINNGANRALQLLEALLKVERMDTGRQVISKVPYAPGEVVLEVLERFQEQADKKKIHVRTDFQTREFIMLDPLWFTQAIENLLSNALKFTSEGGSITFSISSQEECLCLKVQDTGIGIPQQILPQIFNKFTPAKRLGLDGEATTGLGLYLVRQIIEQHKGKIWCESQEGQGSTFFIELPRLRQDSE